MKIRAALAVLLLACLGTVAHGWGLVGVTGSRHAPDLVDDGGEILFAHDYTIGAYPNAGWGSARSDNQAITRSFLSAGCSDGSDAVRHTMAYYDGTVTGGGTTYGGDFHFGNDNTSLLDWDTWGESFFYRGRWRFSAGTDFDGRDQGDGSAGSLWRIKVALFGNNSTVSDSRIIPGFEGYPLAGGGIYWQYYVGIEDQITRTGNETIMGDWFDFQVEFRYSSAPDVEDGWVKIWINNNTYESPDGVDTTVRLNLPDTETISQGYINNGIANGSELVFDHCGIEIGTEFDATWH
jgi:hypothetical protein